MACARSLLLQAVLRGGVPDPVLNISVPCALDLSGPTSCPSDKVVGFDGWRLPSGRVVRGMAALDSLVLKSPDFLKLSDEVKSHVAFEAARLAARPKETCAVDTDDARNSSDCDDTIRGPDDPSKIHYNPSVDDYGCFVTKQGENNCYNYGNDVLTNTFAQPGRGSGVCSHHDRPCVPNTCDDVRKAAESDGLKWMGKELPTELPDDGHYVSLHIWPKSNFHWLRMDANFTWSHKPGGSKVRNYDNNGKMITDPSKCDVSPWSTHCGYMITKPSKAQLY